MTASRARASSALRTRNRSSRPFAAALSAAIKDESTTPLPYHERMTASGPEKVFLIDDAYVKQMVASIVKDQDLSRYIL